MGKLLRKDENLDYDWRMWATTLIISPFIFGAFLTLCYEEWRARRRAS